MKELCFAKICNLNAKNKKSKEKIEKLLAEYNTETMKNNIIVRKQVLRDVSVFGVERLEQMIKEESKEIEKREKRTKEKER